MNKSREILRRLALGNTTSESAAALLGLSIHDIYRLALKHHIALGATAAQEQKSRETAKKVLRSR